MPAYNVFNSRGVLVTTIPVGTTTGSSFPVELIGLGISLYGPIISQTQYYLLENFANDTEPTNPVEGMFWHNTVRKLPNFYDGAQFNELSTANSSAAHSFDMLPTATDVDFTTAGDVNLFTAPSTSGVTHHPTAVILVPKIVDDGGSPPITPATFNIYIDSSEDVMENHNIVSPTDVRHAYFPFNGMTRFAQAAETVKLQIVTPATGAGAITLTYDVVLFGYKNIT